MFGLGPGQRYDQVRVSVGVRVSERVRAQVEVGLNSYVKKIIIKYQINFMYQLRTHNT